MSCVVCCTLARSLWDLLCRHVRLWLRIHIYVVHSKAGSSSFFWKKWTHWGVKRVSEWVELIEGWSFWGWNEWQCLAPEILLAYHWIIKLLTGLTLSLVIVNRKEQQRIKFDPAWATWWWTAAIMWMKRMDNWADERRTIFKNSSSQTQCECNHDVNWIIFH